MAKSLVHKLTGVQKSRGNGVQDPQQSDSSMLAELKATRKAQQDTVRRIAELKLRLLQLTESHWDQSITVLKRWMH